MAALELVPFAMLIADGTGDALAVNQRWIDLSGLSRPDSLGAGWLDALDAEQRHRLRDDIRRVAAGGASATPATSDYQLAGPGRRRWARWWLSGHELEGVPLVAVAAADVDDDYTRQASLYHLATHDSLTGLVNRSHFMESIEQALRRNQRASRHVGVVYVDLDGFKRVNDRGGHSLGDRVLYAIAARLRHAVRSADMVARIGGDEFAVLCEGLGAAEQAEIVARRIATALTESVELDGERWAVAASVGAAVDQGAPDTAEELVDRADQAMYSVKLTRRVDRPAGVDAGPAGASFATAVVDPPPVMDRRAPAAATPRAPAAAPADRRPGGADGTGGYGSGTYGTEAYGTEAAAPSAAPAAPAPAAPAPAAPAPAAAAPPVAAPAAAAPAAAAPPVAAPAAAAPAAVAPPVAAPAAAAPPTTATAAPAPAAPAPAAAASRAAAPWAVPPVGEEATSPPPEDRPAPAPMAAPAPSPRSAGPAPSALHEEAIRAAVAGAVAAIGAWDQPAHPPTATGSQAAPPPPPPAAQAHEPAPGPQSPESPPAPGRRRLTDDVVSLRDSIDSIRRMLDGLLADEGGVIDIREPGPNHH